MPQLGLVANDGYQKVRAKVSEKVLPMVTSTPPNRIIPHDGINTVVEFHLS
jgi:hypothetical protein